MKRITNNKMTVMKKSFKIRVMTCGRLRKKLLCKNTAKKADSMAATGQKPINEVFGPE